MSWHDTSPPHRNHWRRLHGFMAGSPGSSFGDHRQVRRLSRYSYSDQHMNWIFQSRTKNIQIKIPMKYFYPGQKYSDQHTDWIFLFRTKNIQIKTQFEYFYPVQKIFRSTATVEQHTIAGCKFYVSLVVPYWAKSIPWFSFAVFHDKAKRTQQGNLLRWPITSNFLGRTSKKTTLYMGQ